MVFVRNAFVELFKQILLLFGKTFGGLNRNRNQQIASAPAVHTGNALASHREGGSALGSLGDGQFAASVGGGDGYFCAQRRLSEGYGQLQMKIKSVADEKFMSADRNLNDKVACGTAVYSAIALTVQGDPLTVVDACGYVHLKGLALFNLTVAATFTARVLDGLAFAAAFVTDHRALHHAEGGALLDVYTASAAAFTAGLG